jgi:hypothetical protein
MEGVREGVERVQAGGLSEVAQAGGACGADVVLGAGPLVVAQFQRGDRGVPGVGSEAGRCMPSGSVKRNWAPGRGRSFRTISRIPLGRPVRQSPSSSATRAPSRISPSGSTAGVQAEAGTFKTAWWMASVMVMPIE